MGIKTKQLKYWQGKFGNDYIKRNSSSSLFKKRKKFFQTIVKEYPEIKSILEIGCNIGGNLLLINEINNQIKLTGIEPNKKACKIAKNKIPSASFLNESVFDIRFNNLFDLVFTSGVLIHIANEDLNLALENIFNASKKYILNIEYYSQQRKTVKYRSLSDALFKRPYDKEWLRLFPQLKLTDQGLLNSDQGFDNCNWWLYSKV